jgi:UDP-glucose 4-epimerase
MSEPRRIFVTGGAGFIGAHACKALARAGFEPVAIDNLATGHAAAVRYGPFVQADLADRAALDAAFDTYRPEAVMHFAASAQVGEAMRDPARYWRNNVLGALTLIEAALAAGCARFVVSSTCAIYGDQDGAVLDENAAQGPLNAYGASKRAVEDMFRDFGESHGVNWVIFRYFNVAGADPDAEIGEAHDPETHLVPLVLEAAMGKRPALTVHGADYDTPDGTCIRDYVHVSDLVDAHVLGLNWLAEGRANRVFNLGTGTGFSVREVMDTAARVTGLDIPHAIGPRRAGDAVRLVSGGARARAELGWRPQRSDIATIIADAWAWHRKGGFGGT